MPKTLHPPPHPRVRSWGFAAALFSHAKVGTLTKSHIGAWSLTDLLQSFSKVTEKKNKGKRENAEGEGIKPPFPTIYFLQRLCLAQYHLPADSHAAKALHPGCHLCQKHSTKPKAKLPPPRPLQEAQIQICAFSRTTPQFNAGLCSSMLVGRMKLHQLIIDLSLLPVI